ncbi:MAG TPA: hypothetical protein VFU62_07975 [Hanamia sp.]|nr:hypothetical protein [Hanamia sp.]
MKLFSHKKNKKDEPGKDKLATGIAKYIIKVQSAFARYMNALTKNMSVASMKWSLVIFLLIGCSLSICCITMAFLKKDKAPAIKINRIHTPQYFDKNGNASLQQNFLITKKEHQQMLAFLQYIDSLHYSKSGKQVYDSIMQCRPGLVDSVNELEKLYQQQNKK